MGLIRRAGATARLGRTRGDEDLVRTSTSARARALLRRCCRHRCGAANGHACDRPQRPEYAAVQEPGALCTRGPLDAKLQQRLNEITAAAVTRRNSVQLLVDGVQSYAAMLELVERAEHEILFENFIFRSDAIGNAFAETLRQRGEDGVRVRVLHDPFGSLMSLRVPIGFRFHQSPVEVRVYNAPRPSLDFFRAGRDHRKLIVQDRGRIVLGGMCVADMWLGNCVTSCTWRDSTVRIDGDAAADAAAAFERMWAQARSFTPRRPGRQHRTQPPRLAHHAGSVPVRVIADEPRALRTERTLAAVFAAAESEILITNPYVILTASLTSALSDAVARGVVVRLLAPRFSNHHWVGLSAEHRFGKLLDSGVEIWRWLGPLIHAKTVVVDRCWSLVGSTNLDPLSLWRNAEINVEIHGARFGDQLADLFLHDLQTSEPFTLAQWRSRRRFRRWVTGAATLGWQWQ